METADQSSTGAQWRVKLSERDIATLRALIEDAPTPSVAISDRGPSRQETSAQ
jgi:hypothetical protein